MNDKEKLEAIEKLIIPDGNRIMGLASKYLPENQARILQDIKKVLESDGDLWYDPWSGRTKKP